MSNIQNELKREFQIERMILFTDAVFAIAITLLVIEIKAPSIHHLVEELAGEGKILRNIDILHQLMSLIPLFIGFIISFFVIAIYWRSHHRLFSFVRDYDEKLIWLNFFFLFTIILMPFSSAYYSDNFDHDIPFYFYCINVSATGFVNYLLLSYIIKHRGRISEGFDQLKARKMARWRTLIVPSIFLFGAFLCYILPYPWSFASRYTPMLIWPAMMIIQRSFGKVTQIERK